MKTFLARFCIISVLVLVASGCSSADESIVGEATGMGDSADTNSVEHSAEQLREPDGVDGEGGDEAEAPRSLDDYLGMAVGVVRGRGGAASVDQDALLEQERLIQQEIQACMQAQGFTYTPEQVDDGLARFLRAEGQSAQTPQDYAETQGFGITTRFDELFEDEVDLVDEVSPNEEHLATLSAGEADAWRLALRGQPPERNDQGQLVDPETGEVLEGVGRGGATGGCAREAQDNVRGDLSALAALGDEYEALTERIASDPRVTEMRRAWSDCMAAEGFDYVDESEAREDFTARLRPLMRSFFGSTTDGPDVAVQGPGAQGGRGQAGGAFLQAIQGLQLTDEQAAELDALQDLERAVAVASLQCQGDSADELAEITAGYEAAFVEENLELLESLGS